VTAPRNRTVCQLTGQQADPEALRPSRFFTALAEVIPGALERVTAERDELAKELDKVRDLLGAQSVRVQELEEEVIDLRLALQEQPIQRTQR
jgi:hypothetical protein